MISGVHVLLSYTCLFQCDHCFLHCSPESGDAFTMRKLEDLLDQSAEIGSVKLVCFEGGEPFLFYPVMERGIRYARDLGFEVEVITNAYWALDAEDAKVWLEPLIKAGMSILDVSDDRFHHGERDPTPAKAAILAARELGVTVNSFRIEPPVVREAPADSREKGEPIVGGDVRFRGRAADELTRELPLRHWREFTECPDEDFRTPRRVHADALGNVQICQGISIGNFLQRPLRDIMSDYDPESDPVIGPLMRGGPSELVREHGLDRREGFPERFVDACHLCYRARCVLRGSYPEALAPAQAYGE
jgi:MoaA/NifB/PqqE/SkfB family radical SAM enzyme